MSVVLVLGDSDLEASNPLEVFLNIQTLFFPMKSMTTKWGYTVSFEPYYVLRMYCTRCWQRRMRDNTEQKAYCLFLKLVWSNREDKRNDQTATCLQIQHNKRNSFKGTKVKDLKLNYTEVGAVFLEV